MLEELQRRDGSRGTIGYYDELSRSSPDISGKPDQLGLAYLNKSLDARVADR